MKIINPDELIFHLAIVQYRLKLELTFISNFLNNFQFDRYSIELELIASKLKLNNDLGVD